MLQIILLIMGIIYAIRRPKLRNLRPHDFPGIDAARFSEWRQAELKGIDIFLWATWGAFVIEIGLSAILLQTRLSQSEAMTWTIVIGVAWLAGLTIAAIQGSKAKKLRTAAGIKWPK